MALEFMKIPGLHKILTALDFKSYLIGVDKLPDYRAADYCSYFITEDAAALIDKLYYRKVAGAKGGYTYEPCSHVKLSIKDHLSACRFFEFYGVTPRIFRVVDGNNVARYLQIDPTHLTYSIVAPADIGNISVNINSATYWRRNIETNSVEQIVLFESGTNAYIKAQGYFYGRATASDSPVWGVANNTYYTSTNGSSFTALNGKEFGSIAAYEEEHPGTHVYILFNTGTSTTLTTCKFYNCGWYIGTAELTALYDIDLSMGNLSSVTLPVGYKLANNGMNRTRDLIFSRGKTYYMYGTDTSITIKTSSGTLSNVTGLFPNYITLKPGDGEYDYTIGGSIAEWMASHTDPTTHASLEVFEDSNNFWKQANDFVGELTRYHEWYERSGERFPYVGFIAIATSNYNGQQRGGMYHSVQKEYALTEDEVHHFRWTDDAHSGTVSKTYYEWNESTNTYTPRDGDEFGNGLIYRYLDGDSYFQKPIEDKYLPGKTYYSSQSGAAVTVTPGDPVADKIYVADRRVFLRSGWNITEINNADRYGVTTDVYRDHDKHYYIHLGNNGFSEIIDGNFFSSTRDQYFWFDHLPTGHITYQRGFIYGIENGTNHCIDKLNSPDDSEEPDYQYGDTIPENQRTSTFIHVDRQYYYVSEESKHNVGLSKFIPYTLENFSDYNGKLISMQKYAIYQKDDIGELPTEVEICVKFGEYTKTVDGEPVTYFDGYRIPSDLELVLESVNGEAILPDSYYEKCHGMFVWKQYFTERGVSVTTPYNVTAWYQETSTKAIMYLKWSDPKFMLHKDDPTASPDAWAKTEVYLEYPNTDTGLTESIEIVAEVGSNDNYAQEFFQLDSQNAYIFGSITAKHGNDKIKEAIRTGTVRIVATAVTGITSEIRIKPSKVVWTNSTKKYVALTGTGGTAVPGVVYYTTNAEGKETIVPDVYPYVTDITGYYVKYQRDLETYVYDSSAEKYSLIVVGTDDYPEGAIAEGTLYTRIPEHPEVCIRDLIREGVFRDLFAPGCEISNAPVRNSTGASANYTGVNVKVVDVDHVNLCNPIEQGYEDIVTQDNPTPTLDANTQYFAKQSVSLKTCADDTKDNNDICYDLVPVVDINNYGGTGSLWTTPGVLFTKTSSKPHYKHFMQARYRVATGLFEVGKTYATRIAGTLSYETLVPNYGTYSGIVDPYTTELYYYSGPTTNNFTSVPLPVVPGESIAIGTTYSAKPEFDESNFDALWEYVGYVETTDETFVHGKNYYRHDSESDLYILMVEDVDWTAEDSIPQFGQTVYVATETPWKFMGWECKPHLNYYVANVSPDYNIGSRISEYGYTVYTPITGPTEDYIDVSDVGLDILRTSAEPLYIEDTIFRNNRPVKVLKQISRYEHNATFKYVVSPGNSVYSDIEDDTYWDTSTARSSLQNLATPDSTKTGVDTYRDFFNNHIAYAANTVFKDLEIEDHQVINGSKTVVADLFWLPCLSQVNANYVHDYLSIGDGQIVTGFPSEGSLLELYADPYSIVTSTRANLTALGTKSGSSNISWLVRSALPAAAVIMYSSKSYEPTEIGKTTSQPLVPYFTIA